MAERLKNGRQWKKDTFLKKAMISRHFDFLGMSVCVCACRSSQAPGERCLFNRSREAVHSLQIAACKHGTLATLWLHCTDCLEITGFSFTAQISEHIVDSSCLTMTCVSVPACGKEPLPPTRAGNEAEVRVELRSLRLNSAAQYLKELR